MITLLTLFSIGAAGLIVKKLDKASEYKSPTGKYKNRYKT